MHMLCGTRTPLTPSDVVLSNYTISNRIVIVKDLNPSGQCLIFMRYPDYLYVKTTIISYIIIIS
jgi:hypothetical protein